MTKKQNRLFTNQPCKTAHGLVWISRPLNVGDDQREICIRTHVVVTNNVSDLFKKNVKLNRNAHNKFYCLYIDKMLVHATGTTVPGFQLPRREQTTFTRFPYPKNIIMELISKQRLW